jgi:hypothetical protein
MQKAACLYSVPESLCTSLCIKSNRIWPDVSRARNKCNDDMARMWPQAQWICGVHCYAPHPAMSSHDALMVPPVYGMIACQ